MRLGLTQLLQRIFVTPMDDYHAVIQLQTGKCTRYYQNLRPQSKFFSESGLSELGSEIYAEFDPVKELIDEIEVWRVEMISIVVKLLMESDVLREYTERG